MARETHIYRQKYGACFRRVPVGFSWTVFFFGIFPALFRRDWVGFLLMFLCSLFTLGFSNWVFMFTYNGWYARRLRQDGYIFHASE